MAPAMPAKHQASVARAQLQVHVGHLGGLTAPRVDDHHLALRVLLNLLEGDAGPRHPVRVPGVLADKDGQLGVVKVAVHPSAQHAPLHPKLAGLLLGQRVRAVLDPQRLQGGVAVGPSEVVSLATASVVEDFLAAMLLLDGLEAGSDLFDGGVPGDGFVTPVGATAHGGVEAVARVLVAVEALGLLAQVALGRGVRLVAANLHELTAVVTAELHLEPTVKTAQDAGRLLPLTLVRARVVHLAVSFFLGCLVGLASRR